MDGVVWDESQEGKKSGIVEANCGGLVWIVVTYSTYKYGDQAAQKVADFQLKGTTKS